MVSKRTMLVLRLADAPRRTIFGAILYVLLNIETSAIKVEVEKHLLNHYFEKILGISQHCKGRESKNTLQEFVFRRKDSIAMDL